MTLKSCSLRQLALTTGVKPRASATVAPAAALGPPAGGASSSSSSSSSGRAAALPNAVVAPRRESLLKFENVDADDDSDDCLLLQPGRPARPTRRCRVASEPGPDSPDRLCVFKLVHKNP